MTATYKITANDGGEFTFTGHLVLDDLFVSVVNLNGDVVFVIPTHRVASAEQVKASSPDLGDLGKEALGMLLGELKRFK